MANSHFHGVIGENFSSKMPAPPHGSIKPPPVASRAKESGGLVIKSLDSENLNPDLHFLVAQPLCASVSQCVKWGL